MKIFDLHNDVLTKTKDFSCNFSHNCEVICAIYKGNLTMEKSFLIAKNFLLKKPKNLHLAFEDIGYKNLNVNSLLSFNPKYVSLTYNGENDFGFGCDYNLPLKSEGIRLAKLISSNGVKIDVAHLSERGVYSLIDSGVKPFCSHTGVLSLKNHKRNFSNEVFKAIKEVGGIIGVTPVSYFMPNNTLNGYFSAIDYLVNLLGVNSVCIGTDFFGCDSFSGVNSYGDFYMLKELMLNNGYTKSDVSAIFYKNAKRYFNA
ncbi:MAG: membrane dipeptidase [Clostridia bacterium]|nr:membrane dipeptidase [Clostridia bacterium]